MLIAVNDLFSLDAVGSFADSTRRSAALDRVGSLDAPSTESEAWRYGPIGDFDFGSYTAVGTQPADQAPDEHELGDRAATIHIVDGFIQRVSVAERFVNAGLVVGPATVGANQNEGLTTLDGLHEAWCPAELKIEIGGGKVIDAPIVIINHHTGGHRASFPSVSVVAGENSECSILEYQTSVGDGLIVPRLWVDVGQSARLRYLTVQALADSTTQLARQGGTVGQEATFVSGMAAFGGSYARLRTDFDLTGRGATGELVALYYGTESQVHDFRTFQHHRARDTHSDMLFKGTVDDKAGSIYTGMIKIHPDGAGSRAYQTNRNIKLSDDAWAWSVPNLEIENNDVRCSHASTVSPVDADQRFYLHARGVPPEIADRLIVGGFFDEVVQKLPLPQAHDAIRRLLRIKLGEAQ